MFAIEILMQTVVIIWSVLQQEGGRLQLPRLMATLQEVFVLFREAHGNVHVLVPPVGNRNEMRIDRCSKSHDDFGQWIGKVLVLTTSESMPFHHDSAAEQFIVRIQGSQRLTFLWTKKTLNDCVPLCVEVMRHLFPSNCAHPFPNTGGRRDRRSFCGRRDHVSLSLSFQQRSF